MIGRITKVRKRDGRLVDFDESKIADAIHKAACAVGRDDRFIADELAGVVNLFLEKQFSGSVPGIEEIQDMVEKVLIETGHARMAKAYILYRERRARAREEIRVQGDGREGPLVGNPVKARVSSWSKSRIADALTREADLDPKVAAAVASSVESKIFDRNPRSITTTTIRALVEAELFERGYSDRVGRQAIVGIPRYDVDQLLRGDAEIGWRPQSPRDLNEAVADATLTQYALAEIYGDEVTDAHLEGRIMLFDVGQPCAWLAARARPPAVADADAFVESVAGMAGRLRGLVTREIYLEGLNADACGWCAGDDARLAMTAARRLLAHAVLRSSNAGSSRCQLALGVEMILSADERAARDGARALGEALIREHWARFRAGQVEGLPELVVRVPVDEVDGEAGRKALMPALAAAAETGRLRFVFDRDGDAATVTPWYRLAAPEPVDAIAAPVAGAVAVNVAALCDRENEEQLIAALDDVLVLAVKALNQKRSFLAALQADPSAPLYRVAAGARPIVAGSRGQDLIMLTGVADIAQQFGDDEVGAARLARPPALVRRRARRRGGPPGPPQGHERPRRDGRGLPPLPARQPRRAAASARVRRGNPRRRADARARRGYPDATLPARRRPVPGIALRRLLPPGPRSAPRRGAAGSLAGPLHSCGGAGSMMRDSRPDLLTLGNRAATGAPNAIAA